MTTRLTTILTLATAIALIALVAFDSGARTTNPSPTGADVDRMPAAAHELEVAPADDGDAGVPHFEAVHVFVDPKGKAIAAWQIEVKPAEGVQAMIVGIEGGEHPAYAEPPYYDPAAMQAERVIVADLSTADAAALPSGRTRLVTIHVAVLGGKGAAGNLVAAAHVVADTEGKPIDAAVTLETETAQ